MQVSLTENQEKDLVEGPSPAMGLCTQSALSPPREGEQWVGGVVCCYLVTEWGVLLPLLSQEAQTMSPNNNDIDNH